ncbi:hypothetical protein [Pseudobutyrivibrio xylanivorans]|uniref:Uncharacterized protein n=1 Tax=Pseudobutyrivibrio xylanivorans TaxID=185007 RepID=A0A5P6VT04_PSEXY|nr:hypothetical protein [Pseudobutyrivibrio xylanivorans]QFJ55835.1 hypothetical protein FXF36_13555 [Pseudobutyrivibrio xylanivorans]
MINITDDEKKVLSGITFHTEEIENGNLCDTDIALLYEMRLVDNYLKDKYPTFTFEITGCEPKDGTVRTYDEWYYTVEGINRDSAFIAMADGDDADLKIKDDFYGEVIREDIKKELEKILESAGIPVIDVNVSFWEYLGNEFDGELSPINVLHGKLPTGNDFKIFLDDTKLSDKDYKKVVADIKNCLKTEGVHGDIYIVVLKNAEADYARDRLFSDSFIIE